MDRRARRELNNGFGDAMARAVEITLTPAIMGGLGYLLDRWLGTWPIFAAFFFVFTIVYVIWKMFVRYDQDMRSHEAKLPGHGLPGHGPGAAT
ncbi:MAG TPA: AtpZ/AtpI family protein [Acidimicrobiales bacterium]|nr:AtpZ/AtpI family protein [Acidimicrobiales bacterium]